MYLTIKPNNKWQRAVRIQIATLVWGWHLAVIYKPAYNLLAMAQLLEPNDQQEILILLGYAALFLLVNGLTL